jgi:hypothetical protein
MPRHNRRRADEAVSVQSVSGFERREQWRDEEYVVRPVSGSAGPKAYRCPGCDQEIRPGTAHLVVWPAGDPDATDRRHWHPACWAARDRRGPVVQRGRSAPKY